MWEIKGIRTLLGLELTRFKKGEGVSKQNRNEERKYDKKILSEDKAEEQKHLGQVVDNEGEQKNQSTVKKNFAQTNQQASCLQTRLYKHKIFYFYYFILYSN